MILSCPIKAIPIIENTEFGGGLAGGRVGLWKRVSWLLSQPSNKKNVKV